MFTNLLEGTKVSFLLTIMTTSKVMSHVMHIQKMYHHPVGRLHSAGNLRALSLGGPVAAQTDLILALSANSTADET